jgi:hypothetical protein
MAPCVEVGRRVDGREAGDEVVFEGTVLSFGGVLAMDGRSFELEGDFLLLLYI